MEVSCSALCCASLKAASAFAAASDALLTAARLSVVGDRDSVVVVVGGGDGLGD
jgi:hypothetical protein